MRWNSGLMSVRLIVLAGLVYWILLSILVLLTLGAELDSDSVLLFTGQGHGVTVSSEPTPLNPPDAVVVAFGIIGVVIGLPLLFPVRVFAFALRISAMVVGVGLLATILRLGILLAPVLGLQLLALYRHSSEDSP